MASVDLFEHLRSPIVEVTVGQAPDGKDYFLHSSLLSHVSKYFKTLLGSTSAESSSRKVVLDEEDPAIFDWFVKWAYTGDLAPLNINDPNEAIKPMIDVYVLGDKLQCLELQNRAMDMMQEKCEIGVLKVRTVTKAVRTGLTESKMVMFLLTQLAFEVTRRGKKRAADDSFCVDEDDWQTFLAIDVQLTHYFMCDLILVHCTEVPLIDVSSFEGCYWHEHEVPPEQPCKRWPDRFGEFDGYRSDEEGGGNIAVE